MVQAYESRLATPDVEFDRCWQTCRRILVDTFAAHNSRAVQETLYAMGDAVLAALPAISKIGLTLPNKHCLPVDLMPFGLENRNEIFCPVDEPHGLIEATVARS